MGIKSLVAMVITFWSRYIKGLLAVVTLVCLTSGMLHSPMGFLLVSECKFSRRES